MSNRSHSIKDKMNVMTMRVNPWSSMSTHHASTGCGLSTGCKNLGTEVEDKVLDITVDTDSSMTDEDTVSSVSSGDYLEDVEEGDLVGERCEVHEGDTVAKALFEGLSIASAKAADPRRCPEVNCMLLHIAAMYRDRDHFDKAVEYFEKALNMARCRLGKDHVDVGRILVNMGRVYVRQGELENAVKCYMDALHIFEKKENRVIVGKRHIDMTQRLYKRISLDLSERLRGEQGVL